MKNINTQQIIYVCINESIDAYQHIYKRYQFNSKMKRLEKQLKLVANMEPDCIQVKEKQNLFHWEVIISKLENSPYNQGDLILDMDFPQQFPFKFPIIKFKTPVWHPNVKDGDICQQMVGQKQWLPNKKVTEIISSIKSMLIHPQINFAINSEAAKQFKQGKFEEHAREIMKKAIESTQ